MAHRRSASPRSQRQYQIAIAYGYVEARRGQRILYNSVQVIGADRGSAFALPRKEAHLFGADERCAYRAGDRFAPPFEFARLQSRALICYDVEYPGGVRSLALDGCGCRADFDPLTDEYAAGAVHRCGAFDRKSAVHRYCNHAGVKTACAFSVVVPDRHGWKGAGRGRAGEAPDHR